MANDNMFDFLLNPEYSGSSVGKAYAENELEEALGLTDTDKKRQRLNELSQKKRERLNRHIDEDAGFGSDSFREVDGKLYNNKNKIFNDLDDAEYQTFLSDVASQQIYKRDDGSLYQLDQEGKEKDYLGSTRRAYMYGTKDSDDEVKFGLARGDLDSSDARYDPEIAKEQGASGYGWLQGEKGVDLNKKYMDMLLPADLATRLEGVVHGRTNALASRTVGAEDVEGRALRGSGASEYYNSAVGVHGDSSKDTRSLDELRKSYQIKLSETDFVNNEAEALDNAYQKASSKRVAELDKYFKENRPEPDVYNTIDALQAGALSAVASTGDFILDIGAKLIGKENSDLLDKWKSFDGAAKATGYDTSLVNKTLEDAKNKFKDGDYTGAFGEMLKNPQASFELAAFSLPMMVEMALGLGKFTKLGKLGSQIKQAEKAGDVAKATKLGEELAKTSTLMNKGIHHVAKNAGFLATVAGQTNNDLDARLENNNGEAAGFTETAGAFALNYMLLGLDRFAFNKITGLEGGKKSLTDAFSIMTRDQKGTFLKEFGKAVARTTGGLTGAAVAEGAQEPLQELGSIINQQLGTEKFKGQSAYDLFKNEENQDQLIESLLAGAGAGAATRATIDLPGETTGLLSQQLTASAFRDKEARDQEARKSFQYAIDDEASVLSTIKSEGGTTDDMVDALSAQNGLVSGYDNNAKFQKTIRAAIENDATIETTTGKKVTPQEAFRVGLESVVNDYFVNEDNPDLNNLNMSTKNMVASVLSDSFANMNKELVRLNADEDTIKENQNIYSTIYRNEIAKIPDQDIQTKLMTEYINSAFNDIVESGTKEETKSVKDAISSGTEKSVSLDFDKVEEDINRLKDDIQFIQEETIKLGSLGTTENATMHITEMMSQVDGLLNKYRAQAEESGGKLEIKKSTEDVQNEILSGPGYIEGLSVPNKKSLARYKTDISKKAGKDGDKITSIQTVKEIDQLTNFANNRMQNKDFFKKTSSELVKEVAKEPKERDNAKIKELSTKLRSEQNKAKDLTSKEKPRFQPMLDTNLKTSMNKIVEALSFQKAARDLVADFEGKEDKNSQDAVDKLDSIIQEQEQTIKDIKLQSTAAQVALTTLNTNHRFKKIDNTLIDNYRDKINNGEAIEIETIGSNDEANIDTTETKVNEEIGTADDTNIDTDTQIEDVDINIDEEPTESELSQEPIRREQLQSLNKDELINRYINTPGINEEGYNKNTIEIIEDELISRGLLQEAIQRDEEAKAIQSDINIDEEPNDGQTNTEFGSKQDTQVDQDEDIVSDNTGEEPKTSDTGIIYFNEKFSDKSINDLKIDYREALDFFVPEKDTEDEIKNELLNRGVKEDEIGNIDEIKPQPQSEEDKQIAKQNSDETITYYDEEFSSYTDEAMKTVYEDTLESPKGYSLEQSQRIKEEFIKRGLSEDNLKNNIENNTENNEQNNETISPEQIATENQMKEDQQQASIGSNIPIDPEVLSEANSNIATTEEESEFEALQRLEEEISAEADNQLDGIEVSEDTKEEAELNVQAIEEDETTKELKAIKEQRVRLIDNLVSQFGSKISDTDSSKDIKTIKNALTKALDSNIDIEGLKEVFSGFIDKGNILSGNIVADINDKIDDRLSKIDTTKIKLDELKNENAKIENKKHDDRIKEIESSIKQQQKFVIDLLSQKDSVTKEMKSKSDSLNKMIENIEDAIDAIEKGETEVTSTESKIVALNDKADKLRMKKRINELPELLQKNKEVVESIESVYKLKKSNKTLGSKVGKIERQLKNEKSKIEPNSENIVELQNKIDLIKNEIRVNNTKILVNENFIANELVLTNMENKISESSRIVEDFIAENLSKKEDRNKFFNFAIAFTAQFDLNHKDNELLLYGAKSLNFDDIIQKSNDYLEASIIFDEKYGPLNENEQPKVELNKLKAKEQQLASAINKFNDTESKMPDIYNKYKEMGKESRGHMKLKELDTRYDNLGLVRDTKKDLKEDIATEDNSDIIFETNSGKRFKKLLARMTPKNYIKYVHIDKDGGKTLTDLGISAYRTLYGAYTKTRSKSDQPYSIIASVSKVDKSEVDGFKMKENYDITDYQIKDGMPVYKYGKDKNLHDVTFNGEQALQGTAIGFMFDTVKGDAKIKYSQEVVSIARQKAISMIDGLYQLMQESDTDEIMDVFGVNPNDESTTNISNLRSILHNGYVPLATINRDLGDSIYKALPIQFSKNTSNDLIEQAKAELGSLGRAILINEGMFNEKYDAKALNKELGEVAKSLTEGSRGQIKVKISDTKEMNLIKLETSNRTKYDEKTGQSRMVQWNTEEGRKLHKEDFSVLSMFFDDLNKESDRNKPVFSKDDIQHKERVRKRNTKLTQETKDYLKSQSETAQRFNMFGNMIYSLYKREDDIADKDKKGVKELVEKMLNIYSVDTTKDIETQISNSAKLNADRLSFEQVIRFKEEAGDREFFIPWDFTVSERYMQDSMINQQENKTSARFMIDSKGMRSNIPVESNGKMDENQIKMFKLAFAQGMDWDLDKTRDVNVIKEFDDKIEIDEFGSVKIKDGKSDLKKVFDFFRGNQSKDSSFDFTDGELVIEIGEAMQSVNRNGEGTHAIQAVFELARLDLKAEENKAIIDAMKSTPEVELELENFEHGLVIESDAITSGMMLTLMQIGTPDAINLLEKGGVYTKEAVEFWTKAANDINKANEKLGIEQRFDLPNGNVTHGLLLDIGNFIKNQNEEYLETLIEINNEWSDETNLNRLKFDDFYNTVSTSVSETISVQKDELESSYKSLDRVEDENGNIIDHKENNKYTIQEIEKYKKDNQIILNSANKNILEVDQDGKTIGIKSSQKEPRNEFIRDRAIMSTIGSLDYNIKKLEASSGNIDRISTDIKKLLDSIDEKRTNSIQMINRFLSSDKVSEDAKIIVSSQIESSIEKVSNQVLEYTMINGKIDYKKTKTKEFISKWNELKKIMNDFTPDGEPKGYESKNRSIKHKMDRQIDILTQMSIIDVVGSKLARSLAKSPVMVFVYGSLIGSIKNRILNTVLRDKMYQEINKLSRDKDKNVDMGKVKELENQMKNFSDANLDEISKNIMSDKNSKNDSLAVLNYRALMNNRNYKEDYREYNQRDKKIIHIGGKEQQNLTNRVLTDEYMNGLRSNMNMTFGSAFAEAFSTLFGSINEYREAIKSMEVMRFQLFRYKLKQKMKKSIENGIKRTKRNDYSLSAYEMNDIFAELEAEGFMHSLSNINKGTQSLEKSEKSKDSKVQTSIKIRENNSDGNQDWFHGDKEVRINIPNIGAVGVISIHSIDGWIEKNASVLQEVLNIYDANMTGTNNAEKVMYDYNKATAESAQNQNILMNHASQIENMIRSLENTNELEAFYEDMKQFSNTSVKNGSNPEDIQQFNAVEYALSNSGAPMNPLILPAATWIKNVMENTDSMISKQVEEDEALNDVQFGHAYAFDPEGKNPTGKLNGWKNQGVDTKYVFSNIQKTYDILSKENILEDKEGSATIKIEYNEFFNNFKDESNKDAIRSKKEAKAKLVKALEKGKVGSKQQKELLEKINKIFEC